jgi:hypothetical protein
MKIKLSLISPLKVNSEQELTRTRIAGTPNPIAKKYAFIFFAQHAGRI